MTEKNLVVVGLGLIGTKRLSACLKAGIQSKNLFVYDPYLNQLDLEKKTGLTKVNRLNSLSSLENHEFTHAIVSVPHDQALFIVSDLLSAGISVLMEKPFGRNLNEAEQLVLHPKSKSLTVGFNYRFMPGVNRLRKVLKSKTLGEISSIRFELGHGGSPDDIHTWKLSPIKSGGGSILDPGIHLIDLLVYLFEAGSANLGIEGVTQWNGFWNTGIEESASIIGYVHKIPFNLTTSIVAWRTRFKLEIIGTDGYIEVNGRGRSDGPQSVVEGIRWGWLQGSSQKNSELHKVFSSSDPSIEIETAAWIKNDPDICNVSDAYEGMKIYELIKRAKVK